MKLYVAFCHDRHVDPTIELFEELEDAIAFCRKYAEDCDRFDSIREVKYGEELFGIRYGEGNDVYVIEREVRNNGS